MDTGFAETLQDIESKPAVPSALWSTGCIPLWLCGLWKDVTQGHCQILQENNPGKDQNPAFNFIF